MNGYQGKGERKILRADVIYNDNNYKVNDQVEYYQHEPRHTNGGKTGDSIMKNIKNQSYCQKCGSFGEHHSYMLNKNWEGLCNDCAFQEHWKNIETMCDEFTKKSGKIKK